MLYRGILAAEDGYENLALALMKQAYELRSDDKINQKTFASLLIKQGIDRRKSAKDEKAAYEKFKLALLYCPDCYESIIKCGESLQLMGNFSRAENFYFQAMNTRPNLSNAYYNLAILYSSYNFNISYRMYLNAIARARYNQEYYLNTGLLCYSYDRIPEAKKYLQQALKIDNSSKLVPVIKNYLMIINQSNIKH